MAEVKELFRIKEAMLKSKLPKHLAFTVEDGIRTAEEQEIPVNEQLNKDFSLVQNVILTGFQLKIPVLTFLLMPEHLKDSPHFSILMDCISEFVTELSQWSYINDNKVKVSVLGKWYDLPGRVVESIKKVLEETKDYDGFFLNLCVNYDGQEEIVSAAQLIARQVKADKLDPSSITKETIKESLYSSYFIPPDLIVKTGTRRTFGGILLWDSTNSTIYFTGKPWSEFSKKDFLNAIELYQKQSF
jgi:undecaprenyl diphosphate synthase